jgi:hypothetical protein
LPPVEPADLQGPVSVPSGRSVRPYEGKESAFANLEEGWFVYFSNLAD